VIAPAAQELHGAARRRDEDLLIGIEVADADEDRALRHVEQHGLVVELLDKDLGAAGKADPGAAELEHGARAGFRPEGIALHDGPVERRRLPRIVVGGMEGNGAIRLGQPPDAGRRIAAILVHLAAVPSALVLGLCNACRDRSREQHQRCEGHRCRAAQETCGDRTKFA
jgi:hypothetical protein